MASRGYETRCIEDIVVGERYRKDLGDIDALARDIAQKGLIQPIVITRDGGLKAGYRRLLACKKLGWTHIDCHVFEDMTPREQLAIEWAENDQRKNTKWQENAGHIARYHHLSVEEEPGWTQQKTADALTVSQQLVNDYLTVYRYKGVPEVWNAPNLPQAVNTARRERERAAEHESELLIESVAFDLPVTGKDVYTPSIRPAAPPIESHSILRADFTELVTDYTGSRFNFLHCDFPFGIESDKSGQGATQLGTYDDRKDVFFQLCGVLRENLDRVCAPSAHMVFWFSMKWYCETWEFLKSLPGFEFDEFPLVWGKSDNVGIAPDPQRGPRRIYETAFFGWRGDRKLTAAGTRGNYIAAPINSERMHPHEKPERVLRHFFEMIVDKNTRMLDPTCGSGTAVRVAKALGAASALGLEIGERFAADAQRALRASNSAGLGREAAE